MPLELKHGFAGKTMGSRKINRYSAINDRLILIFKLTETGFSGIRAMAENLFSIVTDITTRKSDDTDPAPARGRGNGNDGLRISFRF